MTESIPRRKPSLLAGIDWISPEILCVAATLIFMLLGGAAQMMGLPVVFKYGLFLAAYLTGGWRWTNWHRC